MNKSYTDMIFFKRQNTANYKKSQIKVKTENITIKQLKCNKCKFKCIYIFKSAYSIIVFWGVIYFFLLSVAYFRITIHLF